MDLFLIDLTPSYPPLPREQGKLGTSPLGESLSRFKREGWGEVKCNGLIVLFYIIASLPP